MARSTVTASVVLCFIACSSSPAAGSTAGKQLQTASLPQCGAVQGPPGRDGRDGRDGAKGEKGEHGNPCLCESTHQNEVVKQEILILKKAYYQLDRMSSRQANKIHELESQLASYQRSTSKEVCESVQYLQEVQTISSAYSCHETVPFFIDNTQYVAVLTYHDNNNKRDTESVIYEFDGEQMVRYQSLRTDGAIGGDHFQIDGENYIAVANHYGQTLRYRVNSVVYKWDGRKFTVYQSVVTFGARDVEYFSIGNEHFLVFANHHDGSSNDIDSYVYLWQEEKFQLYQRIRTNGAFSVKQFVVEGDNYLVVANHYSGAASSHNTNSLIYRRSGAQFEIFQSIATYGAHDVEVWRVGRFLFLAFANHYNKAKNSYQINSDVYMWRGGRFHHFREIPTNGVVDLNPFTVCGKNLLAVANPREGKTVIYELSGSGFREYDQLATSSVIRVVSFRRHNDTFTIVSSSSNSVATRLYGWIY